jgi:hypothetical protein
LFCGSCADKQETLFNKCPTCKFVLNPAIHDLFECTMPDLPTYDAFVYPDLNEAGF